MKLTVWNQFSSNHSASFVIVGRFPTAEATQNAATELKRIVDSLHAWWQIQPKEEWGTIFDNLRATNTLTPPEEALKTLYGLDNFEETLDWTSWTNPDQLIVTYRDLVIMDHTTYATWSGEAPFDEIFRKLGATINLHSEQHHIGLDTTIKWTTPTQEITDLVLREIQFKQTTHISLHYPKGTPPLEEINAYRRKGLFPPGGERRESFSHHIRFPIEHFMGDTLIMNTSGFELRGIDLFYNEESPEVILDRIVTYLESLGCVNITYEFTQN